ncbi:hypothetical protein TrLO_g813 [Triparma laevis f. longispina]|uniref:Uncharacterized protein n=1 Tax=Triparma laevis f. longispina TaxID=1714387 RepID=A0A9W7AUL3_9STRA|nr:hypothetical protein TrLO_g813 [Triparma laevis f. longispina]
MSALTSTSKRKLVKKSIDDGGGKRQDKEVTDYSPKSQSKVEELQTVKTYIEKCMQNYLTQAEIIAFLHHKKKIPPSITCLVWSKLEEQNSDFFYSYNVRLRLKDQVSAFNYLVSQQEKIEKDRKIASV